MPSKIRTKLEKNIMTIAKKLNIFTLNDAAILTEKQKAELIPVLEVLVSKKYLRQEEENYIYIPKVLKEAAKSVSKTDNDSMIQSLPFIPQKPKEIYLKSINQLDGFVDYFFAPKPIKDRIQKIFKVLKASQGLKGKKLLKTLKEHEMSIDTYRKYKNEIHQNGLVNLVGSKMQEPGEIFYFYKEYYLSPKGLTSEEARELAIQRFERLIKIRLNRSKITNERTMRKWLNMEYSQAQIKKFREYNFSEFDTDKMFSE